ncbi:MAG: glycosyltransferase [Candidatus Omnitrophica bacterium]|nr:glycosyltransferase [Candidatus Omnitrophota bacterium]
MKVAFYLYPSAFQEKVGVEVQLLKTKEYLEKRGVKVHLFNQWQDDIKDFDIFHTFGSVKYCLDLVRYAHYQGVKTVLSTICWYDLRSAWRTYSDPGRRTFTFMRHLCKTLLPFYPSMRHQLMSFSDILFPNSEMEALQLRRYFGMSEEKIFVVPNGADISLADARASVFQSTYPWRNFILFVGRFEPRKNQLSFIRAMQDFTYPIVFIGDPVTSYQNYYEQCKHEATREMHFLGSLPHNSELLASAFAACDTFVLPSWFETPGLAALEAAMAGAKVVITDGGSTKEYFRDYVSYVRPNDPDGIRKTVIQVFESEKNGELQQHIRKNFSWEIVADRTLEGYKKLLGKQ